MSAQVTWGDKRIPSNFWKLATPEPNSGCWLREGQTGRISKARRRAHEVLIGPVPDGQYLESTCGAHCVNPSHVYFREPMPPWMSKNKKRDRARGDTRTGYFIKSKYGLEFADYKRMLVEQNNSCAICEMEFQPFGAPTRYRPHVDHCHTTGVIRGLLCVRCNTGIGALQESPRLMSAAVDYLAKSKREP